MPDLFDAKVRFAPSGSVPSQEIVLSQQLRVAHRLETAQKTLSGSLSASVCSQQATCKGFLGAEFAFWYCCFRIVATS